MDTDLNSVPASHPVQYGVTLACVRELVENALSRPAPNRLRCIPLVMFELKPVPLWKRQLSLLEESLGNRPSSQIQEPIPQR